MGTVRIEHPEQPKVADVIRDIGKDMKTIAMDELELSRREITSYLERLILRASAALLGALVALIGLGMLCIVAVVALEPVMPALWLRLLLMSLLYLAIGGGMALWFIKRMGALHGPDLHKQISEIGETADAVSNGIRH